LIASKLMKLSGNLATFKIGLDAIVAL